MPLQRRLPKRGFKSLRKFNAEVAWRPGAAGRGEVDMLALKQQASCRRADARDVKVIKSGELTQAVKLKGILATAGAKAAIEAAGGSVA
jgi:large subunit ribosomal protein L15